MNNINDACRLAVLLLMLPPISALAQGSAPAQTLPTPPLNLYQGAAPAAPELVSQLTELDRQLFDSVFGCKLDVLANLVDDDLEFLHDKWGRTAASGKEFLAAIAQGCERQATGTDFTARRELIDDSMSIHVLNKFGAMQMGSHRFYAVHPGKPDRLTETGKFIDIWRNQDGQWRLVRVISYDHRLAEHP